MEIGFLYGLSNESMPNMLKVGVTKRTPIERLNEANRSNTWMPTQFKLELAKQVTDPFKKEKILHNILTMNGKRVSPDREFFRISIEELELYFELMDGTLWTTDTDTDIIDEIKVDTNVSVNVNTRNLSNYFMNEQQIRHIIDDDIMELTFNSFTNTFVYIDEETQKPIHCGSLRRIANIHNNKINKDELYWIDNEFKGRGKFECKVDGKWVPIIDNIKYRIYGK